MGQRLELLGWMQDWSMNTYMYGPKDDLKMRAAWRETYNEDELTDMMTLLGHCRQRGIAFVYTVAPGLDIRYADEADLQALRGKLEGLLDRGVEHFCILFDDIPLRMSEADEARFGSLAAAQAFVTNEAFRHVRTRASGLFLLCPTDYCARMTKPSVAASSYLKELGEALDSEIDVFWTGPEIVSETISSASIRELREVLRRKPLIWDNLHANDYDIRRIYLGPFANRPSELKREVRGILTNPNNEFEANFVPLRTLAHYAHKDNASEDGAHNDSYEPRAAYIGALEAWLPRFGVHGKEAITLSELELFGDLFYLFFEHGERARVMLSDARTMLTSPPESWGEAFTRLEETSHAVSHLFHKLTELQNRDLLYAVYGYVWEIDHEIRYLLRYLEWLRQGRPGERFARPEGMANTWRGGLAADLERLLPLDDVGAVSL